MAENTASIVSKCGDEAQPSGRLTAWRAWSPQLLWLWPDPARAEVRARMRVAIADALGTLPVAEVKRIADLAEMDEPGAALRLSAALLRKRGYVSRQ